MIKHTKECVKSNNLFTVLIDITYRCKTRVPLFIIACTVKHTVNLQFQSFGQIFVSDSANLKFDIEVTLFGSQILKHTHGVNFIYYIANNPF